LHGIGLKLFDIKETIPEKEEEIRSLLFLNQEVALAFGLAETYLTQIEIGMSREEQTTIANTFFRKLGYRVG
jgi:hypothetical protein